MDRTPLYQIIVNGEPWVDSDGNETWTERAADTLADMIATKLGYGYGNVEVIPA
jgi:hypothetical protein